MNHTDNKKTKIRLRGFNNITKSLSFNIYDISYAPSKPSRKEYLEYIDEEYNANRLNNILKKVVKLIGAHIISSSTQDYDPLGASATLMISEGQVLSPRGYIFHLDKSHVSAHSYPETDDSTNLSTFRVDIDISTCGTVSPLKALDFLIESFDSDVVILDYRVRGFTRDMKGTKHYIDHHIDSIMDFIDSKIASKYKNIDTNIYQEQIYHTKMITNEFELENYLFKKEEKMSGKQRKEVATIIKREMEEIFQSRNFL